MPTPIVSTLFSVFVRCIVAGVLWVGIGIVVLVVGAIGGYSAGNMAIALWWASSIALLVWVVRPFVPKEREPANTEGSMDANADQPNQGGTA